MKQENVTSQTLYEQKLETLDIVNCKIRELEDLRVQSAAYRACSNWQRFGCKPSKYFFALEKRNYANKTMFAVILNDGTICKEQKRILEEQTKFYQELYSKNPRVEFDVINQSGIKLNPGQVSFFKQDLMLQEITSAAKSMPGGKVPGCDGLSIEFYRYFWTQIGPILLAVYLEMYNKGLMAPTMRKGVITLIPKKNKDSRLIKNLWPLTLLNTDYKILANSMATRLSTVLDDIIGSEQTGFMKGHHIHDNIRKTMDIITHVSQKTKKDQIVILSIDFEKCFDHIEHAAIYAALRYFGFPEEYTGWIRLFFNDLLICTQNAGDNSLFFSKTRGVNQGCPISPFCYNLIGAIMSHLIQQNPHIQGIRIGRVQTPQVITQFADDTGLYLKYSHECIEATIQVLTHIESSTGLKVSYEKTNIYQVGSLKYTNAKLYTSKEFTWSDDNIKMLGVDITNDVNQTNVQYDKIVEKMGSIVNVWQHRGLRLFGKILLINTLMGSLFVHKMSVLPMLSDKQIKSIDSIIHKFIWQGKKAKIPLKILRRLRSEGGLKLVDFEIKQIVLHCQWVRKIIVNQKFGYVRTYFHCKLGDIFWKCNLYFKDVKPFCVGEIYNFWHQLHITWAKVTYIKPQNGMECKNQIIWYNSCIKQNGQVLEPMDILLEKGIMYISDIICKKNRFLSLEEFVKKFQLQEMTRIWFWYKKLLHSMPVVWQFLMNNDQLIAPYRISCSTLLEANINKKIYEYLVRRK